MCRTMKGLGTGALVVGLMIVVARPVAARSSLSACMPKQPGTYVVLDFANSKDQRMRSPLPACARRVYFSEIFIEPVACNDQELLESIRKDARAMLPALRDHKVIMVVATGAENQRELEHIIPAFTSPQGAALSLSVPLCSKRGNDFPEDYERRLDAFLRAAIALFEWERGTSDCATRDKVREQLQKAIANLPGETTKVARPSEASPDGDNPQILLRARLDRVLREIKDDPRCRAPQQEVNQRIIENRAVRRAGEVGG